MVQPPRSPKFGNGRYLPDAPRLDVPADRLGVQRALAATLQDMTPGHAIIVDPTMPGSISSSAIVADAASVTFTPAGSIAATNLQDAIEELDTEKAAASHTHQPEDISTDSGSEADVLTVDTGIAVWAPPAGP